MKKIFLITVFFVMLTNVLAAQDLIVLRDGNVIEAKITEISSTEIRYKRFNHLDGPTIIVPAKDVLSLRYENGTVEIVNAASAPIAAPVPTAAAAASGQMSPGGVPQTSGGSLDPSLGPPTLLQTILNTLPAITIAGNSLRFQFGGNAWVALLNGQNFSKGIIDFVETAEGGTLTLMQTHIYPGAIGETAGRIASRIPGGGQVGSVLSVAGSVAGALGPIEASGTIVLNYRSGPPPSLSFVSSSGGGGDAEEKRADVRKNWIMGEIGVVGLGVRYERMLGRKTSLSLHPYYNSFFISYGLGIDVIFRWYPWGKKFFMGTGLGGYHRSQQYGYGYGYGYYYDLNGMGIPLELGWKFDPGRAGKFYMELGLGGTFLFGKYEYYYDESSWGLGGEARIYFGMGGSF